jgi:ADP-ribose pyrophosphatase YjhB (NUDIX family)
MELFLETHPEFWGREMDQIRLDEFPGPLNDKPKRNAAYRILHYHATRQLRCGQSVALNATYLPPHARAELVAIVQRFNADLYVVQCACSSDIAVKRFLGRLERMKAADELHAGADLTTTRVRSLAEEFVRFEEALTVDTTMPAPAAVLKGRIDEYLEHSEPVRPIAWASHEYRNIPQADLDGKAVVLPPKKLSTDAIKRSARGNLLSSIAPYGFILLPIVIGLIPLAYRVYLRALLLQNPWHFRMFLLWAFSSHGMKLVECSEFATCGIAMAGIVGLYFAYLKETAERRREREDFLSAGKVAHFPVSPVGREMPSDCETYHSYLCRMSDGYKAKLRMPIPSMPIFFLIEPKTGKSFDVTAHRSGRTIEDEVPADAAAFHLDWAGFVASREEEERRRSASPYGRESGLRCVSNPTMKGDRCQINGMRSEYRDYLAREQSALRFSPGVLPDMRRLLEGPSWDSGSLDLLDCAGAAARYSMKMSITGLLRTSDGYFVLQRRSGRVLAGVGNLNGSVAGSTDFHHDTIGPGFMQRMPFGLWPAIIRRWDLKNTVVREIREEIGIEELSFPDSGSFIGAAFNLRYGRDLNFYSFATTALSSSEIGQDHQIRVRGGLRVWKRDRLRDKWEVDRLEFLDSKSVTVRSVINGVLARSLNSPSRHLMGVLYSWAVYEGKWN